MPDELKTTEDTPDLEAWDEQRLHDEVAFAVSAAGRLRREEREVAFAIEIIRLRTVIRAARDDLGNGNESSAYLALKHSGVRE